MEKKKILILKPAKTAAGGITNYYEVLKDKWTLPVEYFVRGARTWPYREGKLKEIFRAIDDLQQFKEKLKTGQYSLIQTSTSLGLFAVIRDGLFINVAKKQGVKSIVFFRGWDLAFEKKIEKRYLFIFKKYFFQADAMIVLSSKFKAKLREWGYRKNIYLETTIVDEQLFDSIDEKFINNRFENNTDKLSLLFLARLEKEKGIYETLNAFNLAKKNHANLFLTVAGDGFELNTAKKYVLDNKIKDVVFIGNVIGLEKSNAYKNADIYIFPSYSEGLPNSVLEAMAFGLPVIATRVGGLEDILNDNETGFFVRIKNSDDIAMRINFLIDNVELRRKISLKNFEKAKTSYRTNKVLSRVENIYKKILEN